MIYGIGTDVVRIQRLQTMWERHGERAAEKLLAPIELLEFATANDKGRFLAKRFAAKEAFAKAFGTGVRPPAILSAMAVSHNPLGKPIFAFYGDLAHELARLGLTAHLSISDESDLAVAYVILEKV